MRCFLDASLSTASRAVRKLAVVAIVAVAATAAMAEPIPSIDEIPSDIASAYPQLVEERSQLVGERQRLHAKNDRHNAACSAVEEGSAADAACISALAGLEAEIDAHIQRTNSFNAKVRGYVGQRPSKLCPAIRAKLDSAQAIDRRARLAYDVYSVFGQPEQGMLQPWEAPPGFKLLSNDIGQLRQMLPGKSAAEIADLIAPPDSAYRAAIYADAKTGAIFVVFRGTTDWADYRDANIPNQLHLGSDYLRRAQVLGRAIKSYADRRGQPVEFIGHSLGGALATWAGINTGAKVSAFNAENIKGISLTGEARGKLGRQITNYVIAGEIVTGVQTADPALGREVELLLPDASDTKHPLKAQDDPLERHRMGVVMFAAQNQLDALKKEYTANRCDRGTE